MATFLELCQGVARESGTIPGNQPTTVTGLTGRLAKVAYWVNEAYRQIQNSRAHWRWMQGEFSGVTIAGEPRYTAASWSLARWAEWVATDNQTTIYKQSDGVAHEASIKHIDYHSYRQLYARGSQDQKTPIHWSVSNAGKFCLGPVPDAVYVVNGLYRKTPQTLAAAGDIPEMPVRFHDLIIWDAILLLAEHDEAQIAMATALRRSQELRRDLMRDQLPIFKTHGGAEPLA